jgi:preprotein translocase subunit SecA
MLPAKSIFKHLSRYRRLDPSSLHLHRTILSTLIRRESNDVLAQQWIAIAARYCEIELNLSVHDEQLAAAWWMSKGAAVEMATGEGKTISGIIAATYLSLIHGQTRIITANEHLAERDAELAMNCINSMEMTAHALLHRTTFEEKKKLYSHSSIIYSTATELGFDYLRDRVALTADSRVQSTTPALLVDEIDSVLIDEGKTPLVIAQQSSSDLSVPYIDAITWAKSIKVGSKPEKEPGDEENLSVDAWHYTGAQDTEITTRGYKALESFWLERQVIMLPSHLYSAEHLYRVHLASMALKALNVLIRDKDYIVDADEIVIIDPNTGRATHGRRWDQGLHQLIEIKEGLSPKLEQEIKAKISLQKYITLHSHIAGMSGTIRTVSNELHDVYGVRSVFIPPHKKVIRKVHPTRVAINEESKFLALIEMVQAESSNGRPILIGTDTIESSEKLSELLTTHDIKHALLSAKYPKIESKIISQAGNIGHITVATHMAGRGTDIVLSEEAKAKGGLLVISAEPHDDVRLDAQLIGRCGRQGDPGDYISFCSPEDQLFKLTSTKRIHAWIKMIRITEYETASHPSLDKIISISQSKALGKSLSVRESLQETERVVDLQRSRVYGIRDQWLVADIEPLVDDAMRAAAHIIAAQYCDLRLPKDYWDCLSLNNEIKRRWGICIGKPDWESLETIREVSEAISTKLLALPIPRNENTRVKLMQSFDKAWQAHLEHLDEIDRNSVLEAYVMVTHKVAFAKRALKGFMGLVDTLPLHITDGIINESLTNT